METETPKYVLSLPSVNLDLKFKLSHIRLTRRSRMATNGINCRTTIYTEATSKWFMTQLVHKIIKLLL